MFEKYIYDAGIATALNCPNKAHMVEYIIWSIKSKEGRAHAHGVKDGKQYMWDSHKDWHTRMPWVTERTIRNYINELKEIGLVETAFLSKVGRDRTTYFRVNMEMYNKLRSEKSLSLPSGKNFLMHPEKISTCMRKKFPDVPITKTHTNTQTNTQAPHKKCVAFDLELAKRWLDYSRIKSPNGRFNELKFAEAVMRMRTKYRESLLQALQTREIEQAIEGMFSWIQNDEFWNKQSPSPTGLLRPSKSDPDLTKLEQVLKQITGRKKSKSERVMESILTNEEVDPDDNPLRLK